METRRSIYEVREISRAETMDIRYKIVLDLIGKAQVSDDHWLAFNLIDAARVVWGRSHDEEFDVMAVHAMRRARSMQDAALQ